MSISDVLTHADSGMSVPIKKPHETRRILGDGLIHALNASVSYLAVGRWLRAQGFDDFERLDYRNVCSTRLSTISMASRRSIWNSASQAANLPLLLLRLKVAG